MAYSTEVLADTPTIYWRLEDTWGTTAADSSGNSHPGTATSITNSASPCADTNKAARFSGSGRIYSVFNPWTGGLSMEALVRTDNYASAGNKCIIGSDAANPQLVIAPTGNIFFFYNGLSNIGWSGVWTQDNIWKHVLLTFSQTNAANCKLYINGVSQGAFDQGSTGTFGTLGNFTAGARAASPTSFMVGHMDEIAMYNSLITSGRVSAHFAQLASLQTPVVTIQSGPTASKISAVSGKDSSGITWSSSMAFTDYQIRVVSNSTDGVTAGTLVETNQTPAAGGTASTNYTDSITESELVAASAGDGSKLLKVFVKTAAGYWSA